VKNLRMAQKLGLLVCLLLIITVIVAVVGAMQLSSFNTQVRNLVNVTATGLEKVFQLRNRILQSIRWEKSSALSSDDADSLKYAEKAREQIKEANDLRTALAQILEQGKFELERRQLDDFNRHWDAFLATMKKVLELSLENTNTKATRLIEVDLTKHVKDFSGLAKSLEQSAEQEFKAAEVAKDPTKMARSLRKFHEASRLRDLMETLRWTVYTHNAASDDQVLNQLDSDVRQIQDRLATTFESLLEVADERDKGEVKRYQSIMNGDVVRIADDTRRFSRRNSTSISQALSLKEAAEAADACDKVISSLIDSMRARMEDDKKAMESAYQWAVFQIVFVTVVGIIFGGILGYTIERGISGPMSLALSNLHRMAVGDLSQRLKLDRNDEIGEMTQALDKVSDHLVALLHQVRDGADGLGQASTHLQKLAGDLMAQSEETTVQASTVASGTEELTATIQSMAGASEQLNMNVTTVSTASEEISVNVKGISDAAESANQTVTSLAKSIEAINQSLLMVAREAREGSDMTGKARTIVDSANTTLTALDHSADEITKVTDTIKGFALQTNLLALNATIEATAAGEAGKGFAVVASEIKELAQQSARSAGEIASRIDEVRRGSRQAVASMREVMQTIGVVSTSAGRISDSVASQTETARAIAHDVDGASKSVSSIAVAIREVARGATDTARNTSEAATGTRSLSQGAAEAAKVAQSIAGNIHGVSEASRLGASNASSVHSSSLQLGGLAETLRKAIQQFRLN
jgi:methyl-accepting chemotaxis protein